LVVVEVVMLTLMQVEVQQQVVLVVQVVVEQWDQTELKQVVQQLVDKVMQVELETDIMQQVTIGQVAVAVVQEPQVLMVQVLQREVQVVLV
jgi:hypothetical protein|tara:strand:+ start:151 stop:423 length:273 start_codon:yes stop_codon:yes gene_type:complete